MIGAHTIGQARCVVFRNRLYNFDNTGVADPTLNAAYLAQLQTICPSSGDDDTTSPLDATTPIRFDNKYFTKSFFGSLVLFGLWCNKKIGRNVLFWSMSLKNQESHVIIYELMGQSLEFLNL